jgi:hypothetical protein
VDDKKWNLGPLYMRVAKERNNTLKEKEQSRLNKTKKVEEITDIKLRE